MSFLNKRADESSGALTRGRPLTGIITTLPAVVEYLTAEAYPDGTRRERSTLSIFLEDGTLKVCLSDRDQGRTLWRAGPSIEDVLADVELAIAEGSADWRRSGATRQGGRSSGKK